MGRVPDLAVRDNEKPTVPRRSPYEPDAIQKGAIAADSGSERSFGFQYLQVDPLRRIGNGSYLYGPSPRSSASVGVSDWSERPELVSSPLNDGRHLFSICILTTTRVRVRRVFRT